MDNKTDLLSPMRAAAGALPELLPAEQVHVTAVMLKALAVPVRLRLMSLIAAARDGEVSVCELTEQCEVSQPTISHHLKKLREAGLLTNRRSAHNVLYRVATGHATEIMQLFSACATLAADIAPGISPRPDETG